MTSDLIGRNRQHRQAAAPGFTAKYRVHKLVRFEMHDSADSAISREKQIKKWNRAWKIELIGRCNPYRNDLYTGITG
ncbi:MAG: GIY-YIG nuclease family protein [Casimicrobiaceae bacterium]